MNITKLIAASLVLAALSLVGVLIFVVTGGTTVTEHVPGPTVTTTTTIPVPGPTTTVPVPGPTTTVPEYIPVPGPTTTVYCYSNGCYSY